MKPPNSINRLFLALVFLMSCMGFTACNTQPYYPPPVAMQPQQPYDYIQGPGGQQMVACYDNSGTRFLLDYMLFNSLMSSPMGYGSVTSYYGSHRSSVALWNNSYSSWGHYNGRAYSNASWRSSYKGPAPSWRASGPTSTYRSTQTSTPSSYRSTAPSSYRSSTPVSRPSSSSWSRPSSSSYRSSSSSSYRSSSSGRRH